MTWVIVMTWLREGGPMSDSEQPLHPASPRPNENPRDVTFVAVEQGAAWPHGPEVDIVAGAGDIPEVAQLQEEDSAQFAERVLCRATSLKRAGR